MSIHAFYLNILIYFSGFKYLGPSITYQPALTCLSKVFIVNYEQISYIVLVLPLLI